MGSQAPVTKRVFPSYRYIRAREYNRLEFVINATELRSVPANRARLVVPGRMGGWQVRACSLRMPCA